MPDDTATPPPLPNAVLSGNAAAAADAALASARSPMDAYNDMMGENFVPAAPQPPHGQPPAQPGHQPPMFTQQQRDMLEAARARDRGEPPGRDQQHAAAMQQAARQDGQQPPEGQPGENVTFKRPNSRTRGHIANIKQQAAQQIAALEQQIATLRAGQQPGSLSQDATTQQGAAPLHSSSAPAQQGAAPLDLARLPLAELASKHPEVQRLKQERDSFYEEIKHVRVEADPEFRAKFDSRRDAAIGAAKKAAGGAAEDIAKILANPDPEVRRTLLAERTKDFSDSSKARLTAVIGSLDALDLEREMEIASRKATWDQTQAARQQQQQAALEGRFSRMEQEFSGVAATWKEQMPFVMNNPDRVIAEARRVFSGETDSRALADAAMRAAVFPDVLKVAQQMGEEIERLQEQVNRLSGAYPTEGGGGYVPPSAPVNRAILPGTYDSGFAGGLEAARRADSGTAGW